MRIFLAGASGVIGIRLVPLMVGAGHQVAAMTRRPDQGAALAALGAVPLVCDVYDGGAVTAAVADFRADLVMHQLTDLPDDAAQVPARTETNNRMRREGTANLLAAAGTAPVIAQSVAFPLPGDAGAAVAEHEAAVLAHPGVVIRYGQFYGPGTFHPDGRPDGPAINIDEAARRTMDHLDAPPGSIVTIVDDGEGLPTP